jgi:5-methylcytosine-specific restriction endonuclease McrA
MARVRKKKVKNPEHSRLTNGRKRARRAGVESTPYTRHEVWTRGKKKCHVCGKQWRLKDYGGVKGWTVDHVIAIRDGGPDTLLNVLPACSHCNNHRSNGKPKKSATIKGIKSTIRAKGPNNATKHV